MEKLTRAQEESETNRLEAFSDGVLAVIITIMVLELPKPEGSGFDAVKKTQLLLYLLSFVFVGIYWNNHHHMLRAARHISGAVMWSNLHLLFWLSLTPFVTEWMGHYPRASAPAATYAVVALGSAISYTILQLAIIKADGPDSTLAAAIGDDLKGRVSVVAYLAAFGGAFIDPIVSYVLFSAVALMWFVPDRRLA